MPPSPFENETVELVERRVTYQGRFRVALYTFRHGLYQGGTSEPIHREVFERGQVAAVLPYDPVRDELILIRQFRAGSFVAGRHAWTWEIVAGVIEDDETAEDLARREAVEEAGMELGELIRMHSLVLSPGACSETCTSFVGRADTSTAGGIFGLEHEGENILVRVVSFARAMEMLEAGEIDNAVAVLALQWIALHRSSLRERWR